MPRLFYMSKKMSKKRGIFFYKTPSLQWVPIGPIRCWRSRLDFCPSNGKKGRSKGQISNNYRTYDGYIILKQELHIRTEKIVLFV